ncbi:MAG: peptidoglycan DD-metalloendopeptidase family protein [Paludibacteraceae bacterium]|nr:peptidoglycan DD-metalloendopeptidase family protein [Paludibacteraceae bacterium]
MKRLFLLIVPLLIIACNSANKQNTQNDEQAIKEIRYEYGIPVDSFRIQTGTVQQGETLSGILNRLGAPRSAVNQLANVDKQLFDVRQIRQGKQYMAFYAADTLLEYFVYEQSRTQSVVFHLADSLHVEKQQKQIITQRKTASATIESSLWNAFSSQGVNPQLALELSEVYQWTVDFFGLQRGDRFDVIYDEQYVDDLSIGIGTIYAARCQHAGATLYAYRFDHDDDCHGYFDQDGKSLRKAFLKAPLNYKRISSTFTYARKHPIYKTVRPHTGVDYAAPMGTPVVALGDGTVIEKGYKGGGGNTVKIRHNSTYTTAYLHLSKYGKGVEVGKHVDQGQVIGYVGSTGASTGPHLDFRVWKNGTPVNPLTLESPSVDPVPQKLIAEFDSIVAAYNTELPK